MKLKKEFFSEKMPERIAAVLSVRPKMKETQ